MFRLISALLLSAFVSGCAANATKDLKDPVAPMGHFRLGHAEVVAPNLQKLLVSREATPQQWIDTVDLAFEKRFRRFEGDQFYHIGVSVEAYSLPPPVVPGKSALAMHVSLWRDATHEKVTEEPKLFHIIQVFETRLGLTKEDQMKHLAEQAALDVENWMREQMETEGWFAIDYEIEPGDETDAEPSKPSEDAAEKNLSENANKDKDGPAAG